MSHLLRWPPHPMRWFLQELFWWNSQLKLGHLEHSRVPLLQAADGLDAFGLGEGILAVVHDAAVVVGRAQCGYLRVDITVISLKKLQK